MHLRISSSTGLPECSGWIEKFSLGRGIFSSHKWCRRFIIVTHAGIGYMHHEPASARADPSRSRCFIPFEGARQRTGEVPLRPVFLLCHVNALLHREAPETDDCAPFCGASPDGGGAAAEGNRAEGYYFALSFEDRGRRLMLLLRTESVEDYQICTFVLSLYVSIGSRSTLIPVAHPLLMQRYADGALKNQARELFPFRWFGQKETYDSNAALYVKDPDPCSSRELSKVRRYVLAWDEGERGRFSQWCGEVLNSNETTVETDRNEEELLSLAAELNAACDVGSPNLHEEVELSLPDFPGG